jgi:hypothetical protein
MTVPGWDEAYAASKPAPWDIGRPQPAAFGHGWTIVSIEAAAFELNQTALGIPAAQAWLAVIERTGRRRPSGPASG